MELKELSLAEAGEHLLGVFRALFDSPKFRDLVDKHFVIEQYYDDDGKILRVEIKDKESSDEITQERGVLH
tara:strand:+ start:1569 stop:1781 length:213 start_codon:yes stop_codon:yes gene_type:complete